MYSEGESRGVSNRRRVTYIHWGGGVLQRLMQVYCFIVSPQIAHTHMIRVNSNQLQQAPVKA